MLDADGDWVETEVGNANSSVGYSSVYRFIGTRFAEVRKINGIMYGRMKES